MTKAKYSQRRAGPWHRHWLIVDKGEGYFPLPKTVWVSFVPLKVYENENNHLILLFLNRGVGKGSYYPKQKLEIQH